VIFFIFLYTCGFGYESYNDSRCVCENIHTQQSCVYVDIHIINE